MQGGPAVGPGPSGCGGDRRPSRKQRSDPGAGDGAAALCAPARGPGPRSPALPSAVGPGAAESSSSGGSRTWPWVGGTREPTGALRVTGVPDGDSALTWLSGPAASLRTRPGQHAVGWALPGSVGPDVPSPLIAHVDRVLWVMGRGGGDSAGPRA